MMNPPTQTVNALPYSDVVYGYDEAPAVVNCCGRDQLSFGGNLPTTAAVAYGGGDTPYPSVEAGPDLYGLQSRCRDELNRGRSTDYRHIVTSSPYFGGGGDGGGNTAYQCSGTYSRASVLHGDCYKFQTPYGGQADFSGCAPATKQHVQDCAVAEDDHFLHQTSTFDHGITRACRTLQRHQQHHYHQQQQQQQQQLARPTYKWMTIKRGHPKTASNTGMSKYNALHSPVLIVE